MEYTFGIQSEWDWPWTWQAPYRGWLHVWVCRVADSTECSMCGQTARQQSQQVIPCWAGPHAVGLWGRRSGHGWICGRCNVASRQELWNPVSYVTVEFFVGPVPLLTGGPRGSLL